MTDGLSVHVVPTTEPLRPPLAHAPRHVTSSVIALVSPISYRPWSGAKTSDIRAAIDGQSCRNAADYCVMNDCTTLCVDGNDYTAQCTRMGATKICTRTCNKSSYLYCAGACIEIDRKNCGACGTTCAANQDCGIMAGQIKCIAKCGVDQQRCNGNCVRFDDRNNCGNCKSAVAYCQPLY